MGRELSSVSRVAPPAPPRPCLSLGVTGHREDNAAFAANRGQIEIALNEILDIISTAVETKVEHGEIGRPRLHSLLAEGADLLAAEQALRRGWDLIAPLPFGLALNVAINALPQTADDARALLAGGQPASVNVRRRAENIRRAAARARLFELADDDKAISALLIDALEHAGDAKAAASFAAESSLRVESAARVMIEQSDIVIAVWDGVSRAFVGGTGQTVQRALESDAPVVWIDANAPEFWRILHGLESIAAAPSSHPDAARNSELQSLVHALMRPASKRTRHGRDHGAGHAEGFEVLAEERWPGRSNPLWHGYRRLEALFGADTWEGRLKPLKQVYETPAAIVTGSAAKLLARVRALPGQDDKFVEAVEASVFRRFAWADGISAHLSDAYRGGMALNFLLAPLAIVGGIAYLPFATSHEKWAFAALELVLLIGILGITLIGQRRRWHSRWFETRRMAEYLRHAPIMLFLGVARPAGRWPKGTETSWPEWCARLSLREVGLPRLKVTQAFLRGALQLLLDEHVVRQRDYHLFKARRLAAAHHNLDKLSELLFALAVISVSAYLILKVGALLHVWPKEIGEELSYVFTFLGVALPTFGAAIAGIRYFGDFERFSAISEVTAERLSAIHDRISQLLAGPDAALQYGEVVTLAHAVDDAVIAEIESWQAVFAGKNVAVPV